MSVGRSRRKRCTDGFKCIDQRPLRAHRRGAQREMLLRRGLHARCRWSYTRAQALNGTEGNKLRIILSEKRRANEEERSGRINGKRGE